MNTKQSQLIIDLTLKSFVTGNRRNGPADLAKKYNVIKK